MRADTSPHGYPFLNTMSTFLILLSGFFAGWAVVAIVGSRSSFRRGVEFASQTLQLRGSQWAILAEDLPEPDAALVNRVLVDMTRPIDAVI